MALFRLLENPIDESKQINPYLNGWDRREPISYGEYPPEVKGVCISHPAGDIKKIAVEKDPIDDYGDDLFWYPHWDNSPNGPTKLYPGSSGVPLYNHEGNVVGQAKAIYGQDICLDQHVAFGKFGRSWDMHSDPRRRLKDWLDPNNSDVDYINGTDCIYKYFTNIDYDLDETVSACGIVLQNVKVKNGADVTFDGEELVTINGEFEVQLGSTIEIK